MAEQDVLDKIQDVLDKLDDVLGRINELEFHQDLICGYCGGTGETSLGPGTCSVCGGDGEVRRAKIKQ